MARKKTKKKDSHEPNIPANVASQGTDADELQRRLAAGEPLQGDPIKDAKLDKDGNVIVEPAASEPATEPNTEPAAAQNADPNAQAQPDPTYPRVDPGSVDLPVSDPNAQAQPANDLATLQERFNVLEGKYNSEIARMATALKSSENIIQSQEALIKSLQQGQPAPGAAAQTEPATSFEKLNPDDYSSYGSEMETMAATVNKLIAENQALRGQIASGSGTQGGEGDRIAKVEQTVQNLTGTVALTAKQAYYAALDSQIVDAQGKPEWERINHDPRFGKWLAEAEPLTGIPRKSILLKANQDQNAERVVSIFNEFKRSLQGATAAAATSDPLAGQAVPGAAAAGEETDPNATKQGLVTTEQFTKAKNDFIQGRIDEAAFDKISNGYQHSIAQGWIQP
jgi:hypothetical protein